MNQESAVLCIPREARELRRIIGEMLPKAVVRSRRMRIGRTPNELPLKGDSIETVHRKFCQ